MPKRNYLKEDLTCGIKEKITIKENDDGELHESYDWDKIAKLPYDKQPKKIKDLKRLKRYKIYTIK